MSEEMNQRISVLKFLDFLSHSQKKVQEENFSSFLRDSQKQKTIQ